MSRFACLVLLLALVVGCDSEAPVEPPEGFFVARVVGSGGGPVDGVEAALLVGTEDPARIAGPASSDARRADGRVSLGSSYPHPARGSITFDAFVDADGEEEAWARIYVGFENTDERLPIFEGMLADGEHQFTVDVSELFPGVHYLWVQSGDPALPSGNGSPLYVTAGTPGELPVVIPLGTTDADGFVAVTQPSRFPYIALGSTGRINVFDQSGDFLGSGQFGETQTIRLRTPSGQTQVEEVLLEPSRTVVEFRLD